MRCEKSQGVLENVSGVFGSIQNMKPFWIFFRNGEIGVADLLMERNIFFFNPIFRSFDALQAFMRVDIEVKREIGLQILGGKMA